VQTGVSHIGKGSDSCLRIVDWWKTLMPKGVKVIGGTDDVIMPLLSNQNG
jgi:hypothetical protein